MKVTVCFGNVRVVVPCGHGNILVKDLIREATLRYKKATGKSPDSWVVVHNLQSQGGGILDPDDRLNDVVDDREQILARFEDGDGSHHHGGGDGASGSSVGTGSPDIFIDGDKYGSNYPRTDIEVTGEQIASGVPSLQVRRGSEPTLNQIPTGPPTPSDPTKRWSAAPVIQEPTSGLGVYSLSTDWLDESREEDDQVLKRITRDGSNRLSMQFFDGAGYRWADAADRMATKTHASASLPREARRKEPLGQANNSVSPTPWPSGDKTEMVVIRNQPGPLGIHVVPDYDGSGKDRGLLVQGIEPGGRIDRDGRLAIYDRIVEINGQNLINIPFQRVQEIFKLSLISPELRLKVIKTTGLESLRKPPQSIYSSSFPEDKENSAMVECEQKQGTNTKIATVSPTKKVPAISKNLKGLLTANTRKIGRKIELELIKKPGKGLGFSITTRDNPAGGNCPIYIKNILPEGAAVEDGRLKIGDRLLAVNDEEMTGKTQSEAVSILRMIPPGSKVKIVVSRQEDVIDNSPNLPRIIGIEETESREEPARTPSTDTPPNIPPLPLNILRSPNSGAAQNILVRSPERGQDARRQPELRGYDKNGGPEPYRGLAEMHRGQASNSSVAKIISQFQDAVTNANANMSDPAEKLDNSMVFPWKHKEILTFNIPVHDTEKAGLGISVKGKTSESGDLGIFIKSVINGGAASRDKRLRTNDQLLNVNGISLLQQSNSDAMETLRKAMLHTEGPIPGNITLTIARRASSPGSHRNNRSSNESLLNSSVGSQDMLNTEDGLNVPSTDNSNSASNGSTNTVIYNSLQNGSINPSDNSLQNRQLSPIYTWNPVLERLTGNNSIHNNNKHQQLRNESYYKATHDTWSSSMLGNNSFGSNNVTSTTVNVGNSEPILIEDEYGSRLMPLQKPLLKPNMLDTRNDKKTDINSLNFQNQHSADRMPNNNNTININEKNDSNKSVVTIRNSSSTDRNLSADKSNNNFDKTSDRNTDRSSEMSSQTTVQTIDATYASQLSLENAQGFTRDALGRQSMSEKRHATLDAKNTDTYQKRQKMREERKGKEANIVRVGSVESIVSVNRASLEHSEAADKITELGPSLGMKKSSSLESLQTMVQEIQMQEEGDPAYSYRGPSGALKVIRGRGCEESFRAAVVDPNHRSEIGAKKHWLLDGPVEEREIDGFNRGAPRQSSLNAALDSKNKSGKKKPGIFKGIGSMFRFGKHRKVELGEPVQSYHKTDFDSNSNLSSSRVPNSQTSGHHTPQQDQDTQSHHSQNSDQKSNLNQSISSQTSDRLQEQSHHVNKHHQNGQHGQLISQKQHPNQHPGHPENYQKLGHHQHFINNNIREQQIQREPIYQRHGFIHRHAEQVQVIPENAAIPPIKYRQHSDQRRQNRELHQQRMNQRHTYYQSDDSRESVYDQRHPLQRSESREPQYGEFTGRPGSRSGVTEVQVPFTHYVNYKELQSHISQYSRTGPGGGGGGLSTQQQTLETPPPPPSLLSDSQIVQMRMQVQQQRLKVEEESRKQHQYHSQRSTRPEGQLRPMSNYYEYESVQSVLTNRTTTRQTTAQHGNQSQHSIYDVNSNPHHSHQHSNAHQQQVSQRQQQKQMHGRFKTGNVEQPSGRGPFVTQVIIGNDGKQENGTKV